MQSQHDAPELSSSFEGFLTGLEQPVTHAGKLLLFSGDQFRLDIMLLRHEKNPNVIWGLRRHEEWAFKATLLRFARSSEPVHLILVSTTQGAYQAQGWVVSRTMHDFWASPLTHEQVQQFLEHCPASLSLERQESATLAG